MFPQTMTTAMASPMARPTPRITPARIPDFAAGTITLKMVPIWVLPRARDASLYATGTARRAVSDTLMMVGSTITARMRIMASRLSPTVPGKTRRRKGTSTIIPKKP